MQRPDVVPAKILRVSPLLKCTCTSHSVHTHIVTFEALWYYTLLLFSGWSENDGRVRFRDEKRHASSRQCTVGRAKIFGATGPNVHSIFWGKTWVHAKFQVIWSIFNAAPRASKSGCQGGQFRCAAEKALFLHFHSFPCNLATLSIAKTPHRISFYTFGPIFILVRSIGPKI